MVLTTCCRQELYETLLYGTLRLELQGSPTDSSPSQETYRHALAATTTRTATDGVTYLYTLNLACPEKIWSDMQPQLQKSIDSFRLVEPTQVRSVQAEQAVTPVEIMWHML